MSTIETEAPPAPAAPEEPPRKGWSAGRIIGHVLAAVLIVVIGAVGWTSFKLWRSWESVETVAFDTEESRAELEAQATAGTTADGGTVGETDGPDVGEAPPEDLYFGVVEGTVQIPDDVHGAFLAVGGDNRAGFGGNRADVILLFILPEDGSPPALVSLPRDLYIPDPCRSGFARVNVNLNGCGDVTGPELLAIAVEDFTGVHVDHMALFSFDGFEKVIDEVGGVEICIDYAVRDSDAELRLDAGCTIATGEQALGWVRSRKTLEFRNGSWRSMRGVSDLTRNQRQQDVLLEMLVKAKAFDSVGELTDTVQSLANAFAVDAGLTLGGAIDLAWSLRGLDPTGVIRLEIPVRNYTTEGGAAVLLPTASFTEILAEAYPELGEQVEGVE